MCKVPMNRTQNEFASSLVLMSWRHRGGLHMRIGSFVIAVLLAATSALAHHSNSAFDPEKVVVLKGTVTQWKWTNPHVWIFLSVDDGKGGKVSGRSRAVPPASWPAPAGRRPSSKPATRSPWISARRGTAAAPASPRASRSPMAPCSVSRRRRRLSSHG